MQEWTLDEANRRLEEDGYPPIKRLPADEAAIEAWKRLVDGRRELDETGKLSEATLKAVSNFCHCLKCPTCAVYQVGAMHGTDYFCMTGVPAKKLIQLGGAKGVAAKLLDHEIEKGNPGKRLPERLMAPPSLIGRAQDDVETPEKVPGWS